MYNRRKLHKFIHYYSESDKEFNKSTVKDTFWDDLCQGKLELPSGDLYSSIKTMKRKCNSYSLNEEDFWWNQLLDSPNKDDMSCDETTSKRVGRRRKRKISQTVDKDRFGMPNFSKKPKEETEVPKVGPKKRGRKKKPRPEDLETDCGDAELREGDVLSSQMESDDGSTSVTGDFPETVTRVIAPLTDDVNGMMQTDCPTPSQIIDLSIYSPGSLLEKPLNFPSAIPRSGSVASAGVERFLTGVREIFSSCGFQTRSASKVSHKEGLKLQRNLSKDRQLFQNLASIINTESGIHSPGTEQGSNIFVIDSSSEHSKSSTSSRYFTRCKVENDKQSHQDAVIDSGASVNSPAKESLKISSGIHFPLIIQGCYVKLEKLEMPKALMDGERFKYSLVNEKKNEPSVANIQPIKVCPIDNYTTGAPAEFESKEIDSKVKHVFDRQDDPRSLSDVSHPEAPRTASRFLRETSAEKPSKGVLRRSASDSLLVAFAQGRSRAVADQIASLNHKDKKEPCGRLHDFNQKRLFPKRRIIGHVIDAPAYKMSAFSRKKLKRPVARGRPLICKRRIQKLGNVFSKKDRIVCQSVKEKGDSLAVACLPENVAEDKKIQVVNEECSKHLERELSNLSKIVLSEICEIKEPEIIPPAPSTVETAENVSDAGRPVVSEVCGIMVENISPPCQASDLEPTTNQRSYEGHVNIQLNIIHVEETLRIDLPEIPGRIFQEGAITSRSVTERCGSIVTIEGNNDLGNNLATKQQVAIPRAPVVTENRSVASDPSSIDLSAPTEVPPRALLCNVPAEKDVPRQPCLEPRKRRGNPLDPRLNGKRYQAKRSNQIKPKKLCHYNEKQLLEDCRQKLYALIAEGMLEEVPEGGKGKPVAKNAEEASPAVVANGGLDAARGAKISKSLEALNVNGGTELASSTDRRSEAEKVLPATDDEEKIGEAPHDARQAKPPVKVCKPQDPRRRSDNGAPNREAESTKDDQKDQDWVESLEGRTVPNFSSTSLWPHQLEVIPTAPAPEVIDNAVIHQAVVKGDLRVMERVMTLLPSHVNWDLEQSDEMGDTLLMVAARNDDSQMIILLRNRVNLNHKNHQRKTPLMVAAQNGRLRSVATLLDLGAHIDLRDSKGKTALLLAVENNQDHVVHLLLGRGANFCPLTLTSNNFKDTEEQERAIRINVCLNSHISWVTKYFDSAVLKWACTLGLNKLRALTAVQFMTPCQVQKFEFTFSYRPDTRLAATQERKIILFGAHCVVQYNWFDGEVPMPPELVGGVRCNGVRTASLRDSAFMLANVNKGFNVISIGIRPDLHPEPKVGSCLRDKLAFRAYELSMPPHVVEMFAKKERT